MVNLVWDSSFKRTYKKEISKNVLLKKKFWIAMQLFSRNPFDAQLRTHKLTGKLQGLWAFTVAYDCRVIFKFFDNDKSVLLIDIGTHDEVY